VKCLFESPVVPPISKVKFAGEKYILRSKGKAYGALGSTLHAGIGEWSVGLAK